MINCDCPGCGQKLRVPDARAGQQGKCPRCQRVFIVPGVPVGAVHDSPPVLELELPSRLPGPPDDFKDQKTLLPGANRRARAPATHAPSSRAPGVRPELYDFLAPPEGPDELGRLGDYRVLKVLGAGGMGVVYQAEDLKLNRIVALKALLPHLAGSASNRERFLREARAVARIEHENVVAVFQVGEDRNVPFLAMPLLRGESLEDRLKREGKLPVADVLRIGREAAAGLAAAHDLGLVHRDIKPGNLWLESERGRVKVLDCGMARASNRDSQLNHRGPLI